jgi:hypothetical protein
VRNILTDPLEELREVMPKCSVSTLRQLYVRVQKSINDLGSPANSQGYRDIMGKDLSRRLAIVERALVAKVRTKGAEKEDMRRWVQKEAGHRVLIRGWR